MRLSPPDTGVCWFVLGFLLILAGCSTSPAGAVENVGADAESMCLICSDASQTSALPPELQVKATLDRVCSNIDGCHGAGVEGMVIAIGHEFDQMVGVASRERPDLLRVRPGEPTQSYVYLKLRCEGGISGNCMPGDPGIFGAWIEAGAPTD